MDGECVKKEEAGGIYVCEGNSPNGGMCLPVCDNDDACFEGTRCVGEVCVPISLAPTSVVIDPDTRYQTLIGFGAAFAFDEDTLYNHPSRDDLFDVLFDESGFDAIRIRNRFDGTNADSLSITAELIAEAADRIGRPPTLLLMSGSPPAELKANGDLFCQNGDATCTLTRNDAGDFDYAGYAEYWRSSLEAYEAAGIHPKYVSMQSHPNWVPPEDGGAETSRFLPLEGTTYLADSDGNMVQVELPGYRQALVAVQAEVQSVGSYEFVGPEVGTPATALDYTGALPGDLLGAYAIHFYGIDAEDVDVAALEMLREAAEAADKPILQSEMQADGLETAVLVHYALTAAGASMYLHQQFIAPPDADPWLALVAADDETIEPNANYHALAHFARATDAGWQRVKSEVAEGELLVSTWFAPDDDAFSIVFVNPSSQAIEAEVMMPEEYADALTGSAMTRTVFSGDERSADVGELAEDHLVQLPAKSALTISNR